MRRRAMRQDVQRARDALAIVAPLHGEVRAWQLEIARLITAAERQHDRHEHDADSRHKVATLERTILDARRDLAQLLEHAPEDVRQHGRVIDVRRAIDSALHGLTEAQRLLDQPTRAGR